MPPRKAPARTIAPPASVKRAASALPPLKRPQQADDSVSQARSSRTRDFLVAERQREAELKKQGYCF